MQAIVQVKLENDNHGRGNSWHHTAQRKRKYVAHLTMCGMIRKPFESRVDLVITRILGPRERLWDADSLGRGSMKEFIDALVDCGWFVDDGHRWIRNCDFRQDDSRRSMGPALKIEVYEC